MDTEKLSIFLDVLELGSFVAVARRQNLDASIVSRSISSLEEALGVRLFQRTTRSVTPTPEAEHFALHAEQLVHTWQTAQSELFELRPSVCGRVRLTCSVAFGLTCISSLLPEFQQRYPDIELDCIFSDENLDIVSQGIDVAIRLAPSLDVNLVGQKLFSTHYTVVASPDYLIRTPANISRPKDLEHEQCLRYSLASLKHRWRFRDPGTTDTVECKVGGSLVISNPLGLREAAKNGLGIALLADWLIQDELESGALIQLLPRYQATPSNFDTAAWLLYPSRQHVPARTRAVIDFFVSHFTSLST